MDQPTSSPQTGAEPAVPDPKVQRPGRGFSRRGLIGVAGAGAAVAGLAVGLKVGAPGESAQPAAQDPAMKQYPLYGEHQAGIVTPVQDRLHFVAFDVTTDSREKLIKLLQTWTLAAARMTQGRDAGELGATSGPYDAPPDDTGEAIGLPPSGLTLTFGFGPTLFRDEQGRDRFGLADRQPEALRRLPHFPADKLDLDRSDGDLSVQACADDPQVAVHAIRNLARLAFGVASVRWSQLGFGRTSSTSTTQTTPRNLFGFKDGTANLKAEDPDLLDQHVWVAPDADAKATWLAGGSYLVVRRISMIIEVWDRQSLREQEQVIGRTKAEGAPLSGGTEFAQPDFSLKGRGDEPIIPVSAHVRLAHPDQNNGVQLLRRGYNFVDGSTNLGRLDSGLFFIAYLRDPRTHYIGMQTQLAKDDGLSEYLQHTGSALFAVPPGIAEGEYVGQALFS